MFIKYWSYLMATEIDDLELDFNDDFGDGFDDLSLEVENPQDDRNPVAQAKDAAVDAVITKVTDKEAVKDALKEAMPRNYRSTVEFGEQQLQTLDRAKSAMMEPIRKELPLFKRNLNRLTPVVERFLGKTIAGKFNVLTDARKENPDIDQNAQEIKNGLEQAFGSWQEKQEEFQTRQLTQEMLTSQTDESRFNAQYELLAGLELNTRKQLAFNEDVTAQVMRQNLELGYKKYHLLKGLLKVNTDSFGMAITELRNITKNTGLPDLVKQRNSETFKQLFLEEWQGRTVESAVDFGRNYFSKWGENIITRASEIGGEIADTMSQVGDAAGMYADLQEDTADMEDGAEQSLTGLAASTAGGMAGKFGADQAIKEGQKKLNQFLKENPKAARLSKELAMFNATRVESVNSFIDDKIDNGSAIGGILQWLQDLAPTLGQDRENVRNNLIDRITDKAEWDTLQRETLVNIIPGWLSKIHQAIKEIVVGEGNAEKETFDLYTERFVTEREATESMLQNLVKESERTDLNERVEELTQSLFEGFEDQQEALSEEAKLVFKDALVEQARNKPDLDIEALLRGGTYNTDNDTVTNELTTTLNKIINDDKDGLVGHREISDEGLNARIRLASGFKNIGSGGAIEDLQERLNKIDRGGNLDLLRQAGLLDKDGQLIHTELNKLLYDTGVVSSATNPPPSNDVPPSPTTPMGNSPLSGGGDGANVSKVTNLRNDVASNDRYYDTTNNVRSSNVIENITNRTDLGGLRSTQGSLVNEGSSYNTTDFANLSAVNDSSVGSNDSYGNVNYQTTYNDSTNSQSSNLGDVSSVYSNVSNNAALYNNDSTNRRSMKQGDSISLRNDYQGTEANVFVSNNEGDANVVYGSDSLANENVTYSPSDVNNWSLNQYTANNVNPNTVSNSQGLNFANWNNVATTPISYTSNYSVEDVADISTDGREYGNDTFTLDSTNDNTTIIKETVLKELTSIFTNSTETLTDKLCKLTETLESRFPLIDEKERQYAKDVNELTEVAEKPAEDPVHVRLDNILTRLSEINETVSLNVDGVGTNSGLLEDIRNLVAAVASGNVIDGGSLLTSLKERTKAIFSSPLKLARGIKRKGGNLLRSGLDKLTALRKGITDKLSGPVKFVKRKATEMFNKGRDIYVEGDTSPIILGRDVQRGVYYNYVDGKVDGKSITNVKDIKGPIYNTETQQVVLTQEDYDRGLYVKNDGLFKPIKSLAKTAFNAPLTITRKAIELGSTGFNKTTNFIKETYGSVKEHFNRLTDVYSSDGKLLMTAKEIKEGKYYYLKDGKPVPITTFKELLNVSGPIYENVDGQPKVVVSTEVLKEGLRNIGGDKLKMKGLGAALGKGIAKGAELTGKLFKAPLNLLRGGGKLLKGMLDGTLAKATFINLPDNTVFKTQNVYLYTENDPVFMGKDSTTSKESDAQYNTSQSDTSTVYNEHNTQDSKITSEESSKTKTESTKESIKHSVEELSEAFTERAKRIFESTTDKVLGEDDKTEGKPKSFTERLKAKLTSLKGKAQEKGETLRGSKRGKDIENSAIVKNLKSFITNRDEKRTKFLESASKSITSWVESQKEKLTNKVKGDIDGDGLREGGWRARLKSMRDKVVPVKKKPKKEKESKSTRYLGKIVALLGGIAGLVSKGFGIGLGTVMKGAKWLTSGVAKSVVDGGAWVGKKLMGTAGAQAAKGAVATGAKFAGKKLAVAGAGLVLGAVAAPWVAVGLTIAATAWTLWEVGSAIYGYFDRRRDSDLYEFARHLQYGYYTGNEGQYEDNKVNLRYFEKEMLGKITTTEKGSGDILMTPQAIWNEYAGDLGGNRDDEGEAKQFASWYKARFKPVLFKWVTALSAFKHQEGEGWFSSDKLTFSNLHDGLAETDKKNFFTQVMDFKDLSWDPLMIREGASFDMPIQALRPDIEDYIDRHILKLSEVEMAAKKEKRKGKVVNLDDKVIFQKPVHKNEPDKKEVLVAEALSTKLPVVKGTPLEDKDNRQALMGEMLKDNPPDDAGRKLPNPSDDVVNEDTSVSVSGKDTYTNEVNSNLLNTLTQTNERNLMTTENNTVVRNNDEVITDTKSVVNQSSPLTDATDSRISLYDEYIKLASKRHNVDEALIRSIIREGSMGRVHYKGKDGKVGIMPLSYEVAKSLGITNRFDPRSSIMGGTQYLKRQLDEFNGDTKQALAAYYSKPDIIRQARKETSNTDTSSVMENVYRSNKTSSLKDTLEATTTRYYEDTKEDNTSNYTRESALSKALDKRVEKTHVFEEGNLKPTTSKDTESGLKLAAHREQQAKVTSDEIVNAARELVYINRLQLDELKTLNANISSIKSSTQMLDEREEAKLNAKTETEQQAVRKQLTKRPRNDYGTRGLAATPTVSMSRKH